MLPLQCCGEEKWGDWRPHLAMVLSNLTHSQDLDTRTISTMGDTLGMHRSSLPQSSSRLPRCFSTIILFCGSIQRADRRRPLLLLDGPGWSGSLHQEEHQDGSHWLQPQVRHRATGNNTVRWLCVSRVTESLRPPRSSLPFSHFATNEAIQRTEAYEYAQSLGSQPCSLPNFQVQWILSQTNKTNSRRELRPCFCHLSSLFRCSS